MATTSGTLHEAAVHQVLDSATRAPSIMNSQPWRFTVHGSRIDVWLDESRLLPAMDPDGRFAVISCAAAAYNAQLAVRALGYQAWVRVLPNASDHRLLASIHVGRRSTMSGTEWAEFDAIRRRHTNRQPFSDRAVSFADTVELEELVASEGAILTVLSRRQAAAITTMSMDAAHAQLSNDRIAAELARWVGGDDDDGIPGWALGPLPTDFHASVRDMDPHRVTGLRRLAVFERQPTLGVIATWSDTRADWVRAGIAVQRLLLNLTANGLAASFLNAVMEQESGRVQVRQMLGTAGYPQALLRMGYPTEQVQPVPRRSVRTVTGRRALTRARRRASLDR